MEAPTLSTFQQTTEEVRLDINNGENEQEKLLENVNTTKESQVPTSKVKVQAPKQIKDQNVSNNDSKLTPRQKHQIETEELINETSGNRSGRQNQQESLQISPSQQFALGVGCIRVGIGLLVIGGTFVGLSLGEVGSEESQEALGITGGVLVVVSGILFAFGCFNKLSGALRGDTMN